MTETSDEIKTALNTALDEWFKMEKAISNDAFSMLDLLDQNQSNQALQTAFIRSSCAQIEGISYCFTQIGLVASKAPDAPDLPKISEHENSKQRIKKSLKLASIVLAPKFTPNFSGEGWVNLQTLVDTRNTLTHPKSANDLYVSEPRLAQCRQGYIWFIETIRDISQTAGNQLDTPTQKTR